MDDFFVVLRLFAIGYGFSRNINWMYYIADRLLLDLTRPHPYAMAAPYVLGCHSVLFGFCASIICDASLLQLLIKLTID
jgi:hypothetical protein